MTRIARGAGFAALGMVAFGAMPAVAGSCIGQVVDVRPILHYDHAMGEGYLAVRSGPGAVFAQEGELYRGDQVSVYARDGNWFAVQCIAGQCLEPLWGEPSPQGWVYGRYLRLAGDCP